MKTTSAFLLLYFSISISFGQNFSRKIDSLSGQCLKVSRYADKSIFRKIINNRKTCDFLVRIDTIQFDYAFIEEKYNRLDQTFSVYERYFVRSDKEILVYHENEKDLISGVLPRYYYDNGNLSNSRYNYFSSSIAGTHFSGFYEYYYTLDTLLFNYEGLKPFQNLVFDPTLVSFKDSDTSSAGRLHSEIALAEKLKTTYQIITLVDNLNNKILVSFQHPPQEPEIKITFMKRTDYSW